MSPITTHVLDTSVGRPAAGLRVCLDRKSQGAWKRLSRKTTTADGRIPDLLPSESLLRFGTYRLVFETGAYFRKRGRGFYPEVSVVFEVSDRRHHHVPLLLSPFGYSTYRGS